MTLVYFGHPWSAPILDGATQTDTPVGTPCHLCREPITENDQGLIQQVRRPTTTVTGPPVPTVMATGDTVTEDPVHAECLAIGIVGHQYGVCTCNGWDTTTRKAARELWARMGQVSHP